MQITFETDDPRNVALLMTAWEIITKRDGKFSVVAATNWTILAEHIAHAYPKLSEVFGTVPLVGAAKAIEDYAIDSIHAIYKEIVDEKSE